MKITKTYLFFLLVFPVFTLPSACNRVVDKENNTITINQDLPQMDKTTFSKTLVWNKYEFRVEVTASACQSSQADWKLTIQRTLMKFMGPYQV